MPSDLLVIAGTLGGVLVGGLINHLANRSAKSHEWRLALAKDQIASHQKLYAEFLVEAQRLVVEAMERKMSGPTELNAMNSKFAEISLVAGEPVVKSAQAIADYVLSSHSAKGLSEGSNFFALKQEFINAARQDIASFQET